MMKTVYIMTNNLEIQYRNMRLFALLGLLTIVSACNQQRDPESINANSSTPPDTVPVLVLKQDTVKKTAEFPAELIPYEKADLFAKVQGFVKDMKVDMGDHVRKGQVLAVIEAPEVNSRFAESEATVQSAKAKWTSSRDNYERLYRASQAKRLA